jgi:hypothetical protein
MWIINHMEKITTKRDLESLLRKQAGFSRAEEKAIVYGGWPALMGFQNGSYEKPIEKKTLIQKIRSLGE